MPLNHLTLVKLFGIIIISFATQFNCGDSGGDGDGSGSTGNKITGPAPEVVSITPEDGTSGHSRATDIVVEFDLDMKASSVSVSDNPGECSGSIQISSDDFSTCRAGTVDPSSNPVFTVDIAGNLSDDTVYKIKITTAVKSDGNAPMESAWNSQFGFGTGGAVVSTDEFEVVAQDPASGESGVSLDQNIQVEFSEDVNTDSFDFAGTDCDGNVQLSADDFATCVEITGIALDDNPTIAFEHDGLVSGENYVLKITDTVTSASGSALTEFTSDSFTTCRNLANGSQCEIDFSGGVSVIRLTGDYGTNPTNNGFATNSIDDVAEEAIIQRPASFAFIDESLYVSNAATHTSNFATNYIAKVNKDDGAKVTYAGCAPLEACAPGDVPSGAGSSTLAAFRFDIQPANTGFVAGGMTSNRNSGLIYFADSANHKIREINTNSGSEQVRTIAGSGTTGGTDAVGLSAEFNNPTGIVFGTYQEEDYLWVVDNKNKTIRQIEINNSFNVTTIAGTELASGDVDDIGSAARFAFQSNELCGIVYDGDRYLYVSDIDNNKIKRLDLSDYDVETIAGSGNTGNTLNVTALTADIGSPRGLTMSGNRLILSVPDGYDLAMIDLDTNFAHRLVDGSVLSGLAINTNDDDSLFYWDSPQVDAGIELDDIYAIKADSEYLYFTHTNGLIRRSTN